MSELNIEVPKTYGMEISGSGTSSAAKLEGTVDSYTREQADKKFATKQELTEIGLSKIVEEYMEENSELFVGQRTDNGGEIFNDYKNNQALCEFASAMGQRAVSGMKAFRIIGYNIYTYEDLYTAEIRSGTALKLAIDRTDQGLAIGDTVSLIMGKCYDEIATIVGFGFDRSGEPGILVLLDSIPDDAILVSDEKVEEQPWENTLSINAKPHLGDVDVGFGALAAGVDAMALRVGSVATGYKTVAVWIGSDAGGIKTFASFAAFARGAYSKAIGYYSYSAGNNCTVYVDCGFAHGLHLLSSKKQLQALFGQYNAVDDEALFAIGNGTGEDKRNRSNAFTVKKDGRAVLGAEPVGSMDAVPLIYAERLEQRIKDNNATAFADFSKRIESNKEAAYADFSDVAYAECSIDLSDPNGYSYEANDLSPFPQDIEFKITPTGENLLKYPYPEHKNEHIAFTPSAGGKVSINGTAIYAEAFVLQEEFEVKAGYSYFISADWDIDELANIPDNVGVYLYFRKDGEAVNTFDMRWNSADTVDESRAIYDCTEDGKGVVKITVMQGVSVNMTIRPKIFEIKTPTVWARIDGVTQPKKTAKPWKFSAADVKSNWIRVSAICGEGTPGKVSWTYKRDLNGVIADLEKKIKTGLPMFSFTDPENKYDGWVNFCRVMLEGENNTCATLHLRQPNNARSLQFDAIISIIVHPLDSSTAQVRFEQIAGRDMTNLLKYRIENGTVEFYVKKNKYQEWYGTVDMINNERYLNFRPNNYGSLADDVADGINAEYYGQPYALNAGTADRAVADGDGNVFSEIYVKQHSQEVNTSVLTLEGANGVYLSLTVGEDGELAIKKSFKETGDEEVGGDTGTEE